jgi:hypothetical protein
MKRETELLRQAKQVLASGRAAARLAKSRINGSRKQLSQAGDTIVATASAVSATRSTIGKTYRA